MEFNGIEVIKLTSRIDPTELMILIDSEFADDK